MPCFSPVKGYRRPDGAIAFTRNGTTGQLMEVSCGRCIGCRLRRSRDWAVRCVHEDKMHDESCFLTLTYRDQDKPIAGTLVPDHHTLFMKQLRNFCLRKHGKKIRFYMCGEYGDGYQRPHYHYLIFGHGFHDDRTKWTKHRGHQYYRSESLEYLWPYGYALIGNVTTETAAYTARYILKKQTGKNAESTYLSSDPGYEGVMIEPEFTRMSLRPGIGKEWFDKYGKSDIYDSGDFVVINGKKFETPRYYDKVFEDLDERELLQVKRERIRKAKENQDNTPERLETRHQVQKIKAKKLIRGYESQ